MSAYNDFSNLKIINAEVGPIYSLADFQENNDGKAGIYLVYRKNRIDQKLRLIYIGQSNNLSERVSTTHEHYQEWLSWGYNNEDNLYFSSVIINNLTDISRCEAAMIFKFKPPINTDGVDSFSFGDTVIIFKNKDICGKRIIIVIHS